jgi:Lipid A 3-O-deacylase (PagL)
MTSRKCFLFVLILLASLTPTVFLQAQKSKGKFRTLGITAGYGNTFSDNTDYEVFFSGVDFSKSFHVPRKRDFVSWYAQPQFNFVKATSVEPRNFDYEFGLNLGIRNYVHISDRFYFFQMLGSGPHYISAHLQRQATGFIFSDNLALGGLVQLHEGRFLYLQGGIRHISNANIKIPNRGVNSWVVVLGYSWVRRS